MTANPLPSIDYEPADGPSLFDRWERDDDSGELPRTLAVRDERYRTFIAAALAASTPPGWRLISVGAGNGFVESDLARIGWDVVATDISSSALAHCAAKGLKVARLDLLAGPPPGRFDVVYADGLLGHLWEAHSGCRRAWRSFEALAAPNAVLCVSNDLADTDEAAQTAVYGSNRARFFRPPDGWFTLDAERNSNWVAQATSQYRYVRRGRSRRREVLVLTATDGRSGST